MTKFEIGRLFDCNIGSLDAKKSFYNGDADAVR